MAIGVGAALLGSAGASAGSSILGTVLNAKFQSGENELDRLQSEYLTRLQQSNALQQMRIQHQYESQRYQDLMKDLEAAGLNPASVFGTGSISTPHSGVAGASIGSGSHGNNHLGANIDFGSGAFNSAIAYMMRNDHVGVKHLANAVVNTGVQASKEQQAIKEFGQKTMDDYLKEWSKFK